MAQKTLQQAFNAIAAEIDAVNTAEFAGPYDTVADIPAPYDTNDLYLVGTAEPYAIYALIGADLVQLGSTEVDLSNYYTRAEADAQLAAKATTATAAGEIMVNWR